MDTITKDFTRIRMAIEIAEQAGIPVIFTAAEARSLLERIEKLEQQVADLTRQLRPLGVKESEA